MNDETDKRTPDPEARDIHEALGQSDAFLDFQAHLSHVAEVNRPILLVGERGTGKELAATRIHFLSKRWEEPFITLNCAALSPTLIESELFGHEAGAFTGARESRLGRFEAADGGTLFLDEVGQIPLEVQAKILRVVEYGVFERVGSSRPIKIDARIVAATNADLQAQVDKGEFLHDLLDRLSFDVLVLPPLRERLEDISLLSNHFAAQMAFELGWTDLPEITGEAMKTLEVYDWPGNVRELKNVIERAVYRSDDTIIARNELIFDPFRAYASRLGGRASTPVKEPPQGTAQPPVTPAAEGPDDDLNRPLTEAVRELELRMLRRAMQRCQFNQRKAAEQLGLTYHQFRGVYRKYQSELSEG